MTARKTRFGPRTKRPERPRTRFWARKSWPGACFCCVEPFDADFVRSVQNIGRSYDFRTSEHLRDVLVTPKIRCGGRLHTLWLPERSWGASWRRPDGPRRLPGRPVRRFWGILEPPGPSQDRSWDVPARPEPLLDASPDVRGAAPSAPKRPTTVFSRFFVVLGSIFVDPGEIFE